MASVVCWALLLIASSTTNAQTTDPVTGLPLSSTSNVLNLGGGLPWSNTVTGQAGGYSGGSTPAYNPSTGNIIFGYNPGPNGSGVTVSQTAAINTALANAGTGIQLAGYTYSWGINNEKSISNGNRGTVTGTVSLLGPGGSTLESFGYNYSNVNTASGIFQQFSGTQLFNNRYDTTAATGLQVSFTGKDQNYWAGYYGPRVHVNSVDLLYTTNPCATNPAYSPTCAGFKDVVTSNNLLPEPNAVASSGSTVYNTFAVNTALENSGAGVKVYGFNYSYNYSLGNGTYGCTATNQDGSCSWYMTTNPNAQVRVLLTNSNNQTVYTAGQSYSTPNTAENVSRQFLLSSTTNSLSLGNFTMGATTSGNAAVQNMSVTALYTPDPCTTNPLSSTSCPGYGAAFAKQQALAAASAQPAASPVAGPAPDPNSPAPDTAAPALAAGPAPGPAPGPAVASAPVAPAPAGPDPNSQQPPPQQQAAAGPGPATSAPVTSAAPSATNPQPKPGDVQVAGSTKPSSESKGGGSGPSALAMSVVSKEQAKVTATAAAVVAQANEAAATATSAALTIAEAVAGTAQSASITAATAVASSTSSTSTKTASSSSTSVITLQANTPTTLASINNQRTASNQASTTQVAETTSNSQSSLPARNDNVSSTQNTTVVVQQTTTQTLPPAPKQQEAVVSSTQQEQTSSLPPQAPRQQELVQAVVQQVQTINALPTAPQQQATTSQATGQQVQTASLPPPVPRQQEAVQQVVQQSTVINTAPTPPKQTQAEVPVQVTTVAMVQQQIVQSVTAQQPVVQYMPPPQPESNQSSSFVDYSIFTTTNLDTMKKTFPSPVTEVEIPKTEIARASSRGSINDYVNEQAFMTLQGAEQTQDGQIKRNVQPNEVAGGVDIASIATQPKGFDAYAKLTLLDAKFYKSEEVYKNQKTIDNERVLRGLTRGSDRLHQEMVDLQYKQGAK